MIPSPMASSRNPGKLTLRPLPGDLAGTTNSTITAKISASGTLIRKAARHETSSVSSPATAGPPKAATAQIIACSPNTLGTSREGKSSGISAKQIADTTPSPSPCSDRPTSTCSIDDALAAISVPTRNTPAETSSAVREPSRCLSRAAPDPPTMANTRNSVSAQEISATPPISCTAVGSDIVAKNALKASSATPRHRISVTVA